MLKIIISPKIYVQKIRFLDTVSNPLAAYSFPHTFALIYWQGKMIRQQNLVRKIVFYPSVIDS